MTILVTGGTGTVGRHVLQRLSREGAEAHALTRDPDKAQLPEGVVPVRGDLLDVHSVRGALVRVSTLFLLNAVAPDEVA